jgi:hypothetical protein
MERRSLESIVRVLDDAHVRYLIVGGLAVVAHGHTRFTGDVDMLLDFAGDNASRAVAALSGLGYRPRAPVRMEDFADPAARRNWIEEKGLTVFSTWSAEHPATEVDLFVEHPLEFSAAFDRAARFEISPGLTATFVSLADLIAMKRLAGRPVDLDDIRALESLDSSRTQEPE